MKIQIHNKEDAKRLNEEYMAHEENRHFDLKLSVGNRTMTKRAYLAFHHGLRLFVRDLQGNKYFAGAYF